MNRMKKQFLIVVTIVAFLLNLSLPGLPIHAENTTNNEVNQSEEPFSLTIMHVNDTHARVDKFPRLKTAVDTLRAESENHLLLHAGDVFSGTLYFTIFEGLADLEMMNAIGFDAMTFGNHEFDKGPETLEKFVKDAQFPFVSANIDFSKDPILNKYFHTTIVEAGEGDNGKIYPAIVKNINGELVGIFGLTTEDTPSIASPGENITFLDAKQAAEETVQRLEDLGINKIIALSHLGYTVEHQLAQEVDGIDVLVGGHSHTELSEGVLVEKDEPTVIVQSGENLINLGKVQVTFDENGVVQDYEATLLPLENYEADPDLLAKVEEYQEEIDELMQVVIGETTVHLDGERADVRTRETNLGNLIADGMVWKMKQFFPETTIALQNGGGIRASIDEGEITMGEIRTVLPFDNTLVAITLTGQELYEALENSVSQYPEHDGRFLQVSGVKFKFDPNQPAGQRVWLVEVLNQEGEYVPLDLEASYTVATNSFTAQGGDFYDSLKRAYEDGRMINIDIPDYEVLSEYIREFSPVSPQVEGRIVIEEKPQDPTDPGEEPGDQPGETPKDPGEDPGEDPGTTPGDDNNSTDIKDKTPGQQDDQSKQGDQTSPKSGDTPDQTKQDGQRLPDTATNNANLFIIGLALMVVGMGTFLVIRMKSRKFEN